MQNLDFDLRGEVITLDRLLKATGLAASGGGAKAMIAEGRVQVDGREELRKTAQIRAGQVVAVHGMRIRVCAEQRPADPADPTEPLAAVSPASPSMAPAPFSASDPV